MSSPADVVLLSGSVRPWADEGIRATFRCVECSGRVIVRATGPVIAAGVMPAATGSAAASAFLAGVAASTHALYGHTGDRFTPTCTLGDVGRAGELEDT